MQWEPLDLRALDDAGVAAWDALHATIDLEAMPDVELPPTAYRYRQGITRAPEESVTRFGVWSSDRSVLLGEAVVTTRDVEDNRHLAYVDLVVAPSARRRGLARAALPLVCDVAAADGRTKLWLDSYADQPGVAFLEAIGATKVMVGRSSRVFTKDLDRSMLEGWVAKAAERAVGYDLVFWATPTPEEHIDRFVDILHVMNSAPMGDADWEPEIFTPDMVRGWDVRRLATGTSKLTLVARHLDSGVFAGLSEIVLEVEGRPSFGHQDNTGTDPAHRDKGLGRWMKAVMALRILDEHPEVEFLDTWNNDANRPMLNINEAMGFAPWLYDGEYQIEVDAARAAAVPQIQ